MQGFGKFGFYEMFKDVYKYSFGKNAEKYQTLGFLASSACAEVIADCFLAPMEAVRITILSLLKINLMFLAQSSHANR